MKLSLYQIDAFANKVFEGNPAAVIPLEDWLPAKTMQLIALENNLSETAFFCPSDNNYEIRWFTPNGEIELCGHATLASAYVLFNILNYKTEQIEFNSLSGRLTVTKVNDLFRLDFPSQNPIKCKMPRLLTEGLGRESNNCYKNEDYLVVFETENEIANIKPDFNKLKMLDSRGVIITAPGLNYDFVSRAFFPKYGVLEDPVTGSAHTKLIPYWAEKFGKSKLIAKQVSKRGGELFCENDKNRVYISGHAKLYMKGEIEIN
ncbi:PhzF family phenazine biosynthesis protein [Candidatus Marinimicrobia bacterium]|nr:PhzF family phenazine biosynthesis protein [Candidatus Neomarinimicrobiota bacterium]